jgi:hypothetical protein
MRAIGDPPGLPPALGFRVSAVVSAFASVMADDPTRVYFR